MVIGTNKGIIYKNAFNNSDYQESNLSNINIIKFHKLQNKIIAITENGLYFSDDGKKWFKDNNLAINKYSFNDSFEYNDGIIIFVDNFNKCYFTNDGLHFIKYQYNITLQNLIHNLSTLGDYSFKNGTIKYIKNINKFICCRINSSNTAIYFISIENNKLNAELYTTTNYYIETILDNGLILGRMVNSPTVTLYRSSDYGITWNEIYSYSNRYYDLEDFVVFHNILLLLIRAYNNNDSCIFKYSLDNGNTWNSESKGLNFKQPLDMDYKFRIYNDELIVNTANGRTIYSYDGITWRSSSYSDFINRCLSEKIIKKLNSEFTISCTKTETVKDLKLYKIRNYNLDKYNIDKKIDFCYEVNEKIFISLIDKKLYYSDSNFDALKACNINTSEIDAIRILKLFNNKLIALIFIDNVCKYYISDDNGISWLPKKIIIDNQEKEYFVNELMINIMTFIQITNGTIFLTKNDEYLFSSDNGDTWKSGYIYDSSVAIPDRMDGLNIMEADNNRVLAYSYKNITDSNHTRGKNAIFYSDDYVNWTKVYHGAVNNIIKIDINETKKRLICFCGYYVSPSWYYNLTDNIKYSDDNGETWIDSNSPIWVYNVSYKTKNGILLAGHEPTYLNIVSSYGDEQEGDKGGLFYSKDNGETWEKTNISYGSVYSITELNGFIFCIMRKMYKRNSSFYDDTRLYYSTDGINWYDSFYSISLGDSSGSPMTILGKYSDFILYNSNNKTYKISINSFGIKNKKNNIVSNKLRFIQNNRISYDKLFLLKEIKNIYEFVETDTVQIEAYSFKSKMINNKLYIIPNNSEVKDIVYTDNHYFVLTKDDRIVKISNEFRIESIFHLNNIESLFVSNNMLFIATEDGKIYTDTVSLENHLGKKFNKDTKILVSMLNK